MNEICMLKLFGVFFSTILQQLITEIIKQRIICPFAAAKSVTVGEVEDRQSKGESVVKGGILRGRLGAELSEGEMRSSPVPL